MVSCELRVTIQCFIQNKLRAAGYELRVLCFTGKMSSLAQTICNFNVNTGQTGLRAKSYELSDSGFSIATY
jgi:hypothetical protein